LKDAAVGASKPIETGAAFTSLYDSDSYELVVLDNGRQIGAARPRLHPGGGGGSVASP
jgi:hypothetical protein